MPPQLLACSSCGCLAKSNETDCPHCGARLRREGGIQRNAAVLLLGLTAAALPLSAANCADEVSTPPGGEGGMGGMMTSTSSEVVAAYGIGPIGSGGAGANGGEGGTGGAGGNGGAGGAGGAGGK